MSEAAMEKALPDEITTEILTRVPVKPLLRFRCVSKHFCALIDSPFFVNKHLNHSSIANPRFIVSSYTKPRPRIYSAPFEINNNIVKLAVARLNPPFNTTSNSVIKILGSCNGLLCLTTLEEKQGIFFWNPTTGKHRNLRPLVKIPPCNLPADLTFTMYYGYGFGYVSQSNDYKLVHIHQTYKRNSIKVLGTVVDVYSLRSNLWRKIDGFPHGNISLSRRQCPVLVNECLHWLISQPLPTHPYDLVVAFEIGSESFRMVSLPMVKVTNTCISVQVLGGCLCASYQFENVGFDVWLMKKYGVKDSWTKLFTIDHSNVWDVSKFSVWVPLAYSRNGDKVFLKHYLSSNGRIISYDLVRRTVGEVDIHGMPKYYSIMAYSESLVNPNDECLHDGQMQHSQEKGR